ncbi:flagellar basal body-associated FliL family protein [Sedimentitalea nanhaiensis]|uniref:Flagellar protein FliL n=1 Tax=Sedimentitalea nanhaiensis TaxID=999627 RepID=A0A1I7C807_9RHOB|nr:flagellar basal body-associated FliL family protein [Sedimentitalea nanhaiensis]SFT95514.1 hypothetical protein SAMN05216236_11517 [Sedimentitalea nanhaiensis]
MLSKLIPLVFLLLGIGAGVGAGMFMAPSDDSKTQDAPQVEKIAEDRAEPVDVASSEFVKLNNQFVVPIIRNERVASLVVVSLSIEVEAGMNDRVREREPKLRDSFLRVLFDHSNIGGFDGAFIKPDTLDVLRRSLREVAQKNLGEYAIDVLITDIARQDN